ncbi:VWA domain-containing protein [Amycolatopsis ultiminotia]|uniref:VWA domain-containing protein n=1 Tax=Amycolatopsis ultiminotia TaxID=543629 RepID=A0ABP6V7H2_9PSEU
MPGGDHPRPDRPVLAQVDRAAFAVALAVRLRRGGAAVGLTQLADFVRVLDAFPPHTSAELYWAVRLTLVRRRSDLDVLDDVLDRPPLPSPPAPVAGRNRDPAPGDSADEAVPLPWVTPSRPAAGEGTDRDRTRDVPDLAASALAADAQQPFETLSPARQAELAGLLTEAARGWPTRRVRRQAGPRGPRIDLRTTLARARRTGWEPLTPARRGPRRRRRRLVVLADLSESMRAQSPAYLHLMHTLTAVLDAEAFAFATTLTRLTPVLRGTGPPAAVVQRAGELVGDRFGGTRIAANVAELLHSRWAPLVRGAVVVIASDGWDADPPERLAAVLARLRRRAFRICWLNPRAAVPGFEPRVATMAAALPYCDRFLPAHSFAALAAAVGVVADAAAGPVSSTASRRSRA